MKKLITSTIIVLPLLLLAIMLVSGAITSMITHVYVESVEFTDSDTLVLVMSDEDNPPTALLGVNVFPMKAESRDLAFSVDDGSIATVDASGVLTAKFYGETYVSVASAENAAATARRKVIVTDTAVHALAINGGYDADMYEGRSQQLSVAVYPREAINQSVTWESSDTRVATVSANGTVTAKGAGKATITAISDDNNEIKASVEITGHSKMTDIEVDRTLVVTALAESAFPEVKPVPASSDITLTYRTDNPEIATVDENGKITFLKEGHVTVTVTATDFGGTTIEKKKEYTSTNGYYILPLFEQREYTVDYDYYKNANKALPIPFGTALDGSYREFLSVTYSVDNVLTFDETTKEFRFVGPMPTGTRSLKVTVNARIYDTNNGTLTTDYVDGFTLNVLRNASAVSVSYMGKDDLTSIPVSQKTLTFTEAKQNDGSFAVINVDPENHTNKIAYSLVSGEGIAAITPAGVLTFNEAGTVKVRIEFKDDNGDIKAEKEIDVTYTPLVAGEKDVFVTEPEHKLLLLMQSDGTSDTGVIRLTGKENTAVTCEVQEGEKVVSLDESEAESGVWRVTPLSGGFATVKITETADGKVTVYYIKIYVDRPVLAADFTVWFNDNLCADEFLTSRGSVEYAVTLADNKGSTAGKKLYVSFGETRNGDSSGTITFATASAVTVTFGAEYTDEARGYGAENGLLAVVRTVTTTLGTLNAPPTVTYDGGTLQQSGTVLTFEDIDKEIVLSIDRNSFDPADFDPIANAPKVEGPGTAYVGVSIADGTKITLTARKVCGGAQNLSLSIGGKTFTFGVTVNALAEKLIVSCGETQMTDGNSYDTLLGTLSFGVKLAERADGQQITENSISYSVGGGDYMSVGGGKVEVNVDALTEGKQLLFRSDDMAATLAITIRKVTLADFGLELYVNKSVGDKAAVGTVESADKAAGEVTFALPSDMQSALTIEVVAETDNLLGGFGTDEEFGKMFSADMPGGDCNWSASYEAGQGEIIVTGSFAGAYKRAITVNGFGKSVKINLSHITLASIEFTGFDSGKQEDVYKGYQQVRVFAKHSYYGGKQADYFRVPLVALEDLTSKTQVDPTLLTWKLTRYTGSAAGETVASQVGNKVTYGGNEYTIEEDGEEYVLKDSDGHIVSGQGGKNAQGIAWVDVYSEKDFARIYFGAFGGLSESDVQNDYFGNFDDRSTWTKKVPEGADDYDGSGREFTPSANAYSFLRVEAGDGALNGRNCHFNFNVLDDSALINVFDAAGYYANANIVLQENLYGPGELVEGDERLAAANEKGLFLNSDSLDKTLIYGNGYQVNLEAKTNSMSKYSESDGITINRAYNTVIKCANPTDEISNTKQKMVFRMAYAYYCDLSYYYKFNPAGGAFYAKNTVFSNIFKTAVQLYYNENMYAENCVFTECGTAIQVDNDSKLEPHIYIKGSFDALNYFNKSTLENLSPLIGLMYGSVVSNVKDYLEWHGKGFSANATSFADKNIDKIYVNILLFGHAPLTDYVLVWDGDSYEKAVDTPLENGSKILSKVLYSPYCAWTIDALDENGKRLDNATVSANIFGKATVSADISQLFTEKRYIRLQCEFKAPGVKNYDHIKWHQQEVYRDKTLIAGRLSHIENLKKSLANTRWDDGSGVDGEGRPYEPNSAAAVNTLFAVPMSGRRED